MNVETNSGMLRLYVMLKETSVTRRAVRFYEQQGLLMPAGRDQYGRRVYAQSDLLRLKVIRALRAAGLSLAAIRDVLDARVVRPDDTSPASWVERLEGVLTRHGKVLMAQLEAVRQAESDIREALTFMQGHRDMLAQNAESMAKDPTVPSLLRALLSQPSNKMTEPPSYPAERSRAMDDSVQFNPPTW